MDNDNGGHEFDPVEKAAEAAFDGAMLNLNELKRGDGTIAKGLSSAQTGVLQRAMNPVFKDSEYRQALKMGRFLSEQEADDVVAAIQEAHRFGLDIVCICDWLEARAAGVDAALLRDILSALSSTTFNTNFQGNNKKHWWNNNSDKSSSSKNSPL